MSEDTRVYVRVRTRSGVRYTSFSIEMDYDDDISNDVYVMYGPSRWVRVSKHEYDINTN